MSTAARVVIAAGAVVLAWLASHPPRSDSVVSVGPPAPAGRAEQMRGLCIQLHGGGPENMAEYRKMCDELIELGADSVLFVSHAWQTHAGTSDLHLDAARNPSMAELQNLCSYAAGRGLRVCVMPIVLLSNPRGTEWRGRINPTAGWDGWFERYTQVIIAHARAAEAGRASILMIGSELIKAEQFTARWRTLIEKVRQAFSGRLGYSANWDHYTTDKIGFWGYLDYVGMTSYYTLVRHPNPTLAEVVEGWRAHKAKIDAFHREVPKPILFTEVGWCSQEGAVTEPWNYYHNPVASELGHIEQATCYQAFLDVWGDVPYVGGIYWWEWGLGGGPQDYNYTPRGKPAEKILRGWFRRTPVQGGGNASP
jgi:hypothetical protein